MTVPFGKPVRADDLIVDMARRTGLPVSVMIQVTERCNFRCRHCYQVHDSKRELTTGQWVDAMDDLEDAGVLFLTFSGGEPLLRDDLLDLAAAARERRFAVKLKTNGWLVDDAVARRFAELAFSQVDLSLYSHRPADHDAITGVEGSHARLLDAARRLVDGGVPVLFSVPLMRTNADHIADIIALAEGLGVSWSMDPHLNVCEDGGCRPAALRMSPEQYRRVFTDPRLLDGPAMRAAARRRSPSDRVCNAGISSAVLTSEGDILPCPLLQEPLGNVTRGPFAEQWKSSERRRRIASITWADLDRCATCDLMPWCVRCHGAARNEDGDMLGPSSVACAAAEARRDAVENAPDPDDP